MKACAAPESRVVGSNERVGACICMMPPTESDASEFLMQVAIGIEKPCHWRDAMYRKHSRLRDEIESLNVKPVAGVLLVNLSTGESWSFDSYPDAIEFMKGKKGRWYLTANINKK